MVIAWEIIQCSGLIIQRSGLIIQRSKNGN